MDAHLLHLACRLHFGSLIETSPKLRPKSDFFKDFGFSYRCVEEAVIDAIISFSRTGSVKALSKQRPSRNQKIIC